MEFYYHDVDKNILVLAADGGLAAVTADTFVGELERAIELGCRKLIVDCTRLTYISSYGLGVLLRLRKRLAEKGGDFEIYPTLDDARRAFTEQDDRAR